MAIRRGVSLYSYQQSQFFKELNLEAQIREVGRNLDGADGIEIIDEMSLHYPDPGEAFVGKWFDWMDRYGTVPVTMDVCMDVLQFRDHVMSYEECAQRLRSDIRLAKRLGFRNVRVLSACPFEVMRAALPVAESLDIRLGKEIHQPMALEGRQVTEIIEHAEKTGSKHLGIVPDFGIFGIRPTEVLLAWFERQGAQASACCTSVALADFLHTGGAPFPLLDIAEHTAGNVRTAFARYLSTGECEADFRETFEGVKQYADQRIDNPQKLDYSVVSEAIMLSRTSPDTLRALAGRVVSIHGKFNNMSPLPGNPGEYHDAAIDYDSAILALKQGGYDGYINSEYEGQRYFHDLSRERMMDEVEQVRRHQKMLQRLLAA